MPEIVSFMVFDDEIEWLTNLIEMFPNAGRTPNAGHYDILARKVYDALPVVRSQGRP